MLVGRIDGANIVLGAPRDWDKAKHGHCGGLPVRAELTTAGRGMTSAWFPNADEIVRIQHGAPVYLTVIGEVHPPVAMSVGPVPVDEPYLAPDTDPA
jgi:hypothetical protein